MCWSAVFIRAPLERMFFVTCQLQSNSLYPQCSECWPRYATFVESHPLLSCLMSNYKDLVATGNSTLKREECSQCDMQSRLRLNPFSLVCPKYNNERSELMKTVSKFKLQFFFLFSEKLLGLTMIITFLYMYENVLIVLLRYFAMPLGTRDWQ